MGNGFKGLNYNYTGSLGVVKGQPIPLMKSTMAASNGSVDLNKRSLAISMMFGGQN